MWIFCCGMKRSGSTLQYQIAAHLVEVAGRGGRVEWQKHLAEVRVPEGHTGWKVYKTHNYEDDVAQEFARGNAKGLYVYRDLRDVVVSFMEKQSAPFERLWQRDVLREPIENFKAWTQHPEVLVSRYETFTRDVPAEVQRIAAYLEIPVTEAAAQSIADEYSIDKQKTRIAEAKDLRVVNKTTVFDQHSLLHTNHISENNGQPGKWRTVLTPAQIALIEEKYGDWLLAQGYTLTTAS